MISSKLSNKVEIRDKALNGKGIFAKEDIKKVNTNLDKLNTDIKYKINGKFHDDMLVELEKRKKANDAI